MGTGRLEPAGRAHVFVADVSAEEVTLDPGDARHLLGSLRLRDGEPVTVSDGRGSWRSGRVTATGTVEATGPVQHVAAPSPAVTVAMVAVKGDRPEWAVQKLTEIGVDTIVLLQAARSVVRWEGARATAALDRLRRVSREAAIQARRCWLPELSGPEPFAATVARQGAAVADPSGSSAPDLGHPLLMTGPEGGWSPDELAAAASAGAPVVSLGPNVLRAETAAVTAGVILCALRAGLVAPVVGELPLP